MALILNVELLCVKNKILIKGQTYTQQTHHLVRNGGCERGDVL